MKDWRVLTPEEKAEVKTGSFEVKQKMDDCLGDVLALLCRNEAAKAVAWKLAWGCYAINTPEEIADYCKEVAGC